MRYTGHLDLHRLWERAMRRAELPIAYSQGFHPQPRISLAAALPLGFSSRCEVLEARLNGDIPLGEIDSRLKDNLPADIQIMDVAGMDEHAPALQTQVLSAEYHAQLTEPVDGSELKRKVEALMSSESLLRERRGKSYDLRPLIESLTANPESSSLQMRLAAREGATGRPEEVLTVLGIAPETARVERTRLIFQK